MVGIHFNQIYTKYSKRLLFIAYSVTRDRFLAEDVVQETFIKAFKRMGTVEDFDKMGSWLSSIATRTAIDFLRAEKRKNCLLVEQSVLEGVHDQRASNTEEKVIFKLLKEDISHSLRALSKEYQIVLTLKLQHGLKETEIARLLRLKSSTVKTRIYRARKQLKQMFETKDLYLNFTGCMA
ncbi:MAG TPA: RNA polymerase sigma factor [Bacillales bacterium]|nr:RNA polymerase sigma factor [Bacillales bacterium]